MFPTDLQREYGVEVKVGEPRVNYRETLTQKVEFNYLHKKQSGGSGQFARVIGYVEPLEEDSAETFEFVNGELGFVGERQRLHHMRGMRREEAIPHPPPTAPACSSPSASSPWIPPPPAGVVGNNIPPEFLPACEKGFKEAIVKGPQMGHPVQVRRPAVPCVSYTWAGLLRSLALVLVPIADPVSVASSMMCCHTYHRRACASS